MRVLLVFDKFKGSLSAPQACDIALRALRGRHRDWQLDSCPLTDGGEGFTDILTAAVKGQRMQVTATGPRGGLVSASIGLIAPHQIPSSVRPWLSLPDPAQESQRPLAVIEMSAASGLALLPPEQHDPWQATTYGTGQLIRAASELGAAGILLGVGGSATNDLGLGALSALGLEFRDANGGRIRPPAPIYWQRIAAIEGEVFPSIPGICIACDVTNPLLGPGGAASVYGPQKGLRPEDLPRMEAAMEGMSRLLTEHCRQSPTLAGTPGTGAAGGLPFGLIAGARARIAPGFELVSAWLNLSARIAAADLVLTGEGCFDVTSLSGKGPGRVATLACTLGKTVHVFAGRLADNVACDGCELHAITPDGYSFAQAKSEAPELLARSLQAAF
jgi:glycerate kinase